jgi:hypothetical protein
MTRNWPWTELDIDPVNDERAVKRAYAKKLKAIDPEKQAAAFIELRSAYDYAASLAKHGNAEYNADDDWDDDDYVPPPQPEPNQPAPIDDDTADQEYNYRRQTAAVDEVDSDYTRGDVGTQFDAEFDDDSYRYAEPEFVPDYGAVGTDIAAAMAELSALLQSREEKNIDEHAVKQAFDKVIRSPDLGNIIIANRLESDLAMMINGSGSKGYFLAELADFHFGWTDGEGRFGLEWPMREAQQAAESSKFFRHIDQGNPRSERERLYIQALGWLELGPANWFSAIGRKARVMELLDALLHKAPSVYYTLDQEKIAAWENHGKHVSAMAWPMVNFMLFSTIIMAGFLDVKSGVAGLWQMSAIWALSNAAMLSALLFRLPRIAAVPYYYEPDPVPVREWPAFAAMLLLIILSLLAPPFIWAIVLIAGASAAAIAVTTHPSLPKAEGIWQMVAERRYVIGAFWVAMQGTFDFAEARGYYLFMPAAAAAWAFTHAHPRFQASLDGWTSGAAKLRRWHLHTGILLVAALLLAIMVAHAFAPDANDDWLVTSSATMRAAVIILLLCHDAITGRHVIAMGMQFYLVRIVAGFLLLFSPALAMLILIAVRSLGILFVTARDARAAKAQGAYWQDRGDGVTNDSVGFRWGWIGGGVLLIAIIRVIAQAN